MIHKKALHLAFVTLVTLILFSVFFAAAANNVVPVTRLADRSSAMTADALKPADCSAIALTTILDCPTGGGLCIGTDASELIIGSAADDDIQSGKGDDCIVGGGGNDTIKGEQGIDVCIGGPGTDSFHPSCETQIQ